MSDRKLPITNACWLEHYEHSEPTVTYIERATDYWCSDTETDADIDKGKAVEIIRFLAEAHKIDLKAVSDEKFN